MTGSRLSKRTLDEVMGRNQKRAKKKRKQVSTEIQKSEEQPAQEFARAITNDEVKEEPPNLPKDSPVGDRNDAEDVCPPVDHNTSILDEDMMSDCDDEQVPDIDEIRSIDDEDKVVKVEEMSTSKQAKMDSDKLLSCLLTCGSQRMTTVMYNVVRRILLGRKCTVCGSDVSGSKLAGLTNLKDNLKPTVKMNLLAKHNIYQVDVDYNRAGAKSGVDKYESNRKAPVAMVLPSEWARLDFATPSIRKLIWETEDESKTEFSSIETTPIVRNRSKFTSENTVRDNEGLEYVVRKGTNVQLTFIRDRKLDVAVNKAFDNVENKTVSEVDFCTISTKVIGVEYIPDDQDGHSLMKDDGNILEAERHEKGCDKAGDVIFFLETKYGNARLVNRHNCDEDENPCVLELCNGERTKCHFRSYPVHDVVCIDKTDSSTDEYAPNTGRLEDGTRYFVYRMLIYTDGFNAHRSRLGSMDGFYMIPLGIPFDRRTEAGCLRKICLAPPGVSATDLMDIVIDDLKMGMTKGIDVNYNGEKAKLFLDSMVYNGDSPALAAATGSKGHSGDCPCHVCSFRKTKNKKKTDTNPQSNGEAAKLAEQNGSEVKRTDLISTNTSAKGKSTIVKGKGDSSTTTPAIRKLAFVNSKGVNSTTTSAKRTHRKIKDIERQEENGIETLERLGISRTDAPLMKMSDEVKKLTNIPKTSTGTQVVPNCFDAYRFTLISPDHVFLGLISNVMEVLLKLLKPKERDLFDRNITRVLRKNGLYGRTTVLNSEKKLMKTTISEAFAIVFTSTIAIKCCNLTMNRERKALKITISILKQLANIIVESQRHPNALIDNGKHIQDFNESKGRKRLSRLIADMHKYCQTLEELHEVDPSSAENVDKPNIHRFVELFVHTLPMFGSMRYIEELILEKAHQSAKKAVDMSNNKNPQIQAMGDYLFDDFICRMKSISKNIEDGNVGDVVTDVKEIVGGRCDVIDTDALMNEDIITTVRILGNDVCHRVGAEHWVVEKKWKFDYPSEVLDTLSKAQRFMERVIKSMSERAGWRNESSCAMSCSGCLLRPIGEMSANRRVFKVSPFEVLEVHCRHGPEKKNFVLRRTDLDGERRFIATIGFLITVQDGNEVAYAVGYFFEKIKPQVNRRTKEDATTEDGRKNKAGRKNKNDRKTEDGKIAADVEKDDVYSLSKGCVAIVELSPSVRKAFVAHSCWLSQDASKNGKVRDCSNGCAQISDPPSLLTSNEKWVLKGRSEGFPPRSG